MVYWIAVAVYMASAGEYKKVLGVYTMEYDEDMMKAATYHFFGLLWTMAFIRHMTILILAGAFGVWYWTPLPDKKEGKFSEQHPRPIMASVWCDCESCCGVVLHHGEGVLSMHVSC